MNLRDFFDSQNVQPAELNGMLADIDQAVGQAGYEAGGRGIVYGLALGPTSPNSWAVRVLTGMALFYDPAYTGLTSNRRVYACRLNAATSISLSADYLGANTAVSAGQERWLSIVIRPKAVLSDPRTDSDGNVVNFVSTESGELAVVAGTAAAVGTSIRPVVAAVGIRIADVLITSSMTTIYGPEIDHTGREDFVETLSSGAEVTAPNSDYSLFWQSNRFFNGGGILRAYVAGNRSGAPFGLLLTLNARWDIGSIKWIADQNAPAFALRFGSAGMLFTMRTESPLSGWTDRDYGSWGDSTDTQNTDSVLLSAAGLKIFSPAKSALLKSDGVITASGGSSGDASSVTVCAAICQPAGTISPGGGSTTPLCVWAPFPRPFAATPTQLVVRADIEYSDVGSSVGGGSANDINVATYDVLKTPYGIYVQVQPTAAGLLTRFSRFFTLSA